MTRCGLFFTRCSDGRFVPCVLPRGHNCAHSWGEDLKMPAKRVITSAAARNHKGKRRAARKEAPMSPQSEALKLPPTLTLAPRQPDRRSDDGRLGAMEADGRCRAGIDPPRADLLPN